MRARIAAIAALLFLVLALILWRLESARGKPKELSSIPSAPAVKQTSVPLAIAPAPIAKPAKPIVRPALPNHPVPKSILTHPQQHSVAPISPVRLPIAPTLPRPAPVLITPEPATPEEWKGNNDTSVKHSGQIVIQNDRQWVHFWSEHHPDEAAPDVDFSHNMVVGVFLGERPADSFTVTITGVRHQADALIVDYLQIDPPVGTFQIGMTSYPYHIKVIPATKLKIKFNRLTPQDVRPTATK